VPAQSTGWALLFLSKNVTNSQAVASARWRTLLASATVRNTAPKTKYYFPQQRGFRIVAVASEFIVCLKQNELPFLAWAPAHPDRGAMNVYPSECNCFSKSYSCPWRARNAPPSDKTAVMRMATTASAASAQPAVTSQGSARTSGDARMSGAVNAPGGSTVHSA
jgi:hypothetical protein